MTGSSKRARELARARYERQQQRMAERRAKRRQRNTVIAAVASVLAVVLVVWGVAALVGGGSSTASTTASPTPSAPASTAPSAAAFSCPSPSTAKPKTMTFASEPALTIDKTATYRATIATNCGDVVVDLYPGKAPHAVNSFVFLAQKGFYDNTSCHRLTTVADGLSVLQCGDPTGTGTGGPGYSYSVENAPKDNRYPAGTLALARSQSLDSNGSQFFLTYEDSTIPSPGGYTVFGKVVQGLDILQKIGAAGVDPTHPPRPKVPVQITSVHIVKEPKGASS